MHQKRWQDWVESFDGQRLTEMRLDIFDTKRFMICLEPVESDQRLVSLTAHRSVLFNPDVPQHFDKREIVADWYSVS